MDNLSRIKAKLKNSKDASRFEKLTDLCDRFFNGYWIKPYASANYECFYCGTTRLENGKGAHHSASCPVVKYREIKEDTND